MSFAASCCRFLKSFISKAFNRIVLAFLSVDSKTNKLYVNTYFPENLLLGFGRYCGKALQDSAVFHLFWVPALTNNVFSVYFSSWPVVNNSRNKRVSAFLLYFFGFEARAPFCTAVFLWNSVQNFKAKGQAVLVLALAGHDNLWYLRCLDNCSRGKLPPG